jgi:DNA modification methylase
MTDAPTGASSAAPIVMLDGKVTLYPGDCRDSIRLLADNSVDSCVCDPPYALVSIQKRFGGANAKPANDGDVYARASSGFMGKNWDTGETAFAAEFWTEVYRVLKPGAHVVAFSGTRTYHRMACAIEDAGFEIRDQLAWAYGSGFPKSHDVSKAIDKAAGVEFLAKPAAGVGFRGPDGPGGYNVTKHQLERTGEQTPSARERQGWGTALKPSWEPICLARKPLIGTVAENVIEHGTGALNIDGCRVGSEGGTRFPRAADKSQTDSVGGYLNAKAGEPIDAGRWPANIVHDGSDEVVSCFPEEAGGSGKASGPTLRNGNTSIARGKFNGLADGIEPAFYGDKGSAARFFYSAKADKLDRIGSKHPTVKPVDLMQWLCRLVTPPGGTILDPFAGSGSTGEAAWREGFKAILCERETEYQADIQERMRLADKGPATRKAKAIKQASSAGPLFGDNDNNPSGGGGRQIYGTFADQQPGYRRRHNGG